MEYKSDTKLDEEISQKERELKILLADKKKRHDERTRRDKGMKLFDKMFKLSRCSDDYNVYPEEYYQNVQSHFIEEFSDDKSYNEMLIKGLRKKYIENFKEDIKMLEEQLKYIEEEYEDLE